MVDVAGIDARGRHRRGDRHCRHHREHRAQAEEITKPSGQQRRGDIAGVVEGLVATELMRKALLLHQAERDAGDGRRDQRRGNAVRGLRRGHNQETRGEQNDKSSDDDDARGD